MTERDRFVARVVDAGLKQYGAEAAPEGMEARVLARLRVEPERKRWARWLWAPVCAAAAVVLAVVMVRSGGERSHPPGKMAMGAAVGAAASPANAGTARAEAEPERQNGLKVAAAAQGAKRTTASTGWKAKEPRRDCFFCGEPLSEQEQALVRYAAVTPRAELVEVAKEQKEQEERMARLSQGDGSGMRPEREGNDAEGVANYER